MLLYILSQVPADGITIKIGNYLWSFGLNVIIYLLVAAIVGIVAESIVGWRLPFRSEEHTSELQSRSDLVCRLLLEKKKNKSNKAAFSHCNMLRGSIFNSKFCTLRCV